MTDEQIEGKKKQDEIIAKNREIRGKKAFETLMRGLAMSYMYDK